MSVKRVVYYEDLKSICSTAECIFGGPLIWRNHKYYQCCGTTFLTNYSQIYVNDPDFVKTKVLKKGYTMKNGTPYTYILIFYKKFPTMMLDNSVEGQLIISDMESFKNGDHEWWIVDMLNFSGIADKCSYETIIERVIYFTKKYYNYDIFLQCVEMYGNEKVKSYF